MSKNNQNEQETYSIGCIYCGETIFQFSATVVDLRHCVYLSCPKCNKVTIFNGEAVMPS